MSCVRVRYSQDSVLVRTAGEDAREKHARVYEHMNRGFIGILLVELRVRPLCSVATTRKYFLVLYHLCAVCRTFAR